MWISSVLWEVLTPSYISRTMDWDTTRRETAGDDMPMGKDVVLVGNSNTQKHEIGMNLDPTISDMLIYKYLTTPAYLGQRIFEYDWENEKGPPAGAPAYQQKAGEAL